MGARFRLSDTLKKLLRSEMENAIRESNLGNFDTTLASKYLIEQIPQIDIAMEMGIERSTISRRMPNIMERVTETAVRLYGE